MSSRTDDDERQNDPEHLAELCLNKLNDPVKCVTLYSHAGNYQKILEVLRSYIDEKDRDNANALIKWVFSSVKKKTEEIEKLPHLREIIKSESVDIIEQMLKYLIDNEKNPIRPPLSIDQFVNICLYAASIENVQEGSKMYDTLASLIVDRKVNLNSASLRFFFEKIFPVNIDNEEFQKTKEKKEQLLLSLLNSSTFDTETLETLLALCSAYKFVTARRRIQTALKRFDAMIKDALHDDEGNDIFLFIQDQIKSLESNNDTESLEIIKNSLLSNAPLFICKDVHKYIDTFIAKFPECNNDVLNTLTETNIKLYYLRALLTSEQSPKIELSSENISLYVNFVCSYFPSEVRAFIIHCSKMNINLGDFLQKCKSNQVFDACAVICNKIGEIEQSFEYLNLYIANQVYEYLNNDEKDDVQKLEDAFSLFKDFLPKGNQAEVIKCTKIIIDNFSILIYKAERDYPEKNSVLCDYLRKFCTVASENMPLDQILENIVVNFADFKLGIVRQVLIRIVNDYDYDIDTSRSLTLLFQQDKFKTQDKYILLSCKGIQYKSIFCDACHGLLSEGGDSIKLFECGHIFHDQCLKKQVCPICNPEERLDQDIVRPTSEISSASVNKRLKRFEFLMKPKIGDFQKYVQKKGDISITPPPM